MSNLKQNKWGELSCHRYNNRNDEIEFEENFDNNKEYDVDEDENVELYGLYEDLTIGTYNAHVDDTDNYINLWTSGCID